MKKLSIKSENCILSVNDYDGITIDEKALGRMVRDALPKDLKNYDNYPAKFHLTIEFLGNEGLNIEIEGYELPEEETEEADKSE